MRNIAIALVVLFSCTQIAMAGNGSYDYAYSYRLGGETYYCKSNGTCITSEEKINREWSYQKGLSNALNGVWVGPKFETTYGKYENEELAAQDYRKLGAKMIKGLPDGTYTLIMGTDDCMKNAQHTIDKLAFKGITPKLTKIEDKKATNISLQRAISKETPVYYLNDELETVPDKYKDYFTNLNTLLTDSYKNAKDLDGEVTVLFKFDKKGNLISTKQHEVMSEYNKIVDMGLDRPLQPEEMINEIIGSIESVFPVKAIDAPNDYFIVVKHYTAKKAPFIKPTDKAITKAGKGVLMGIGGIIALPFVILSGN